MVHYVVSGAANQKERTTNTLIRSQARHTKQESGLGNMSYLTEYELFSILFCREIVPEEEALYFCTTRHSPFASSPPRAACTRQAAASALVSFSLACFLLLPGSVLGLVPASLPAATLPASSPWSFLPLLTCPTHQKTVSGGYGCSI